MAFNIHISRIENSGRGDTASGMAQGRDKRATSKTHKGSTALLNIPAGHEVHKYPVRIFDVRSEAKAVMGS